MLTEQFIASIGVADKPSGRSAAQDGAIFIHECQPLSAQRHVFKKSASPANCLAVSDTHVFAAQAEKAVVHVYSREKGNQEATVPFTERITCIALVCDDSVLILGTAEGRIFSWEIASGRQLTTTQSHLQAVTAVVVDPTSNFLLSASSDSTVQIWSIPHLLSFSNSGIEPLSPLRTFTSHKTGVNTLAIGHSSSFCNIAISASSDRVCLVWDYHTNNVLRTFLLPSVPLYLALDPADRAAYVGFEDASIQLLDLLASVHGENNIKSVQEAVKGPIQPPQKSTWRLADQSVGVIRCLSVSFDGCSILSGHESGAILVWEVARAGSPTSLLQAPLPGPVTNLSFLPVASLKMATEKQIRIPTITKPKFGAFDSSNGFVPEDYSLNVELVSNMSNAPRSDFEQALYHTSFPAQLVDKGLNELLSWGKAKHSVTAKAYEGEEDFMALDGNADQPQELTFDERNATLQAEIEALRRLQRASFDKIDRINAERKALIQREQRRLITANVDDIAPKVNGNSHDSVDYDISSDEG